MRQAVLFMVALCLVGLLVLLQFNAFAVALGASSLLLVAVYPFAKRVTYWPQAVLGLYLQLGRAARLGGGAGDLGWPAIVLYMPPACYGPSATTPSTRIRTRRRYPDRRKVDGAEIGSVHQAVARAFYGATTLLAGSGALAGLSWPFYAVLAGVAAHFCWQVTSLDLNDPKDCLAKFKSNQTVGLLVFAAIVLGQIAG